MNKNQNVINSWRVAEVPFQLVDWMQAFHQELLEDGLSIKSIKSYLEDINKFIKWFKNVNKQEFDPSLITSIDLREYRSWIMANHYSPATWNRYRESLRRLVRWAFENGYISYDPFQGVERWEEVEQAPRWLEAAELSRLLRQVEIAVNGAKSDSWKIQAVRDWAMIGLMLYSGLREAEVAGLRVEDVMLGERSGKVIVWCGKGEKKREVPLGREARQALKAWLDVRGNDGIYLFCGKHGDGVSTRLIQRRVGEYGRLAGIDGLTPHMLRHTFAKRLLDKGEPLTVVSRLLGHKRLDTTARYVVPGWSDLEDAVE